MQAREGMQKGKGREQEMVNGCGKLRRKQMNE